MFSDSAGRSRSLDSRGESSLVRRKSPGRDDFRRYLTRQRSAVLRLRRGPVFAWLRELMESDAGVRVLGRVTV